MELALIVSVLSLCGFAGALSYNIYEFRRISRDFMEGMKGIIEGMHKGFERAEKDHRAIMEMLKSSKVKKAT